MFKKTLLAVGLSLFAAASMAATEGTDYVKLEKPMVNAEGKLTKIFSYDCPFCFKYDVGVDPKVLPRIEKETGLAFNPIHLETKGKYGRIGSEFLAMCLLRDKAAGVQGLSFQEGQGRRLRRLSQEGRTLDFRRSRLPQDHDRRHGHQRR